MELKYFLFVLLLATTGCLMYIAYLAWKKRGSSAIRCFFFGICACCIYTFGYAFEIISTTLEQTQFWLRVQYIGISFGTLLWFYTIVLFTNHQWFLKKSIRPIMTIIPVFTFISHYTNNWHHLYYETITMNEIAGLLLVSITPGPFYILHVVYNYFLYLMSTIMLVRIYKERPHAKKQIILMIIGSCGPFVMSFIYISNVLSVPLDVASFGVLLLGVCFIWGIYRYNMMDLVPYALKKVFQSMKDAVIVLDLEQKVISYNDSAKQLFRSLNGKNAIGLDATHVFAPYPELIGMIKSGVKKGRKVKIMEGNEPTYFQVYASDVLDKGQHPVGKMLMLSDITESVIYEEKLISTSKQLQELNAFKDKMFTVIAHDIRDPLSMLISLAEIQKEETEMNGKKQDEVSQEIEKQIKNTFTIVEGLLDWVRSQKGGMVFNPFIWNLSEIVNSNMRLLDIQSDRKQVKIRSDIKHDTMIYADKEMIDLIMRNLISNAIKFTNSGGTILIKDECIGDKVNISVSDTGIGIPPYKAEKLLQDQENLASSVGTAGERGIGLGLKLCKEFVKMNGGEMWFESMSNQGSTFYFSIPVATTDVMERGSIDESRDD